MRPFRVLIQSSNKEIEVLLNENLNSSHFNLIIGQSSIDIVDFVELMQPQIIVLDHFCKGYDINTVLISSIKRVDPEVKIIVLSDGTSRKDVGIVEQGLFYYMTMQPSIALVDIVEAAGKAILRKAS